MAEHPLQRNPGVVTPACLAWLLGISAALRLGFIAVADLDLIGDEAYYWDWSRRLDFGYYSKPPMVAWIIAALTSVFGGTTFTVRLPAVLLGTLTGFLLYQTGRRYFNRQTGLIALLLWWATPASAIYQFIMSIDPPLLLFWVMALYFCHAALFEHRASGWFWAGLACGLALLSKPVALVLPLAALLFIALQPACRPSWRHLLWFVLPMAVLVTPNLLWNASHDWIMFQHASSHFQDENFDLVDRIKTFFGFVGLQTLLWSPVIGFSALVLTVRLLAGWRQLDAKQQWLMLVGPLAMLFMTLLALRQKVEGNWPIPFYFGGLLLLAHHLSLVRVKWALATGFSLVLLAYSLPLTISVLGLTGTRLDPLARLRGWQALAAEVQIVREQKGLTEVYVDAHRYLASELAFYLPDQPKVFRYSHSGRIESQYELWPKPEAGSKMLLITPQPPESLDASLSERLSLPHPLTELLFLPGQRQSRRLYLYQILN
ncbi:MAG: glycosyltransferase family 39 protein [Methylococcales bacterium]|nr:glycosyltransferase family 39 protein [Methylococcales bacterium]